MWYNSNTNELQSMPPWGTGWIHLDIQAQQYADWQQVAEGFVPPEPLKTTEELLSELDAEYQPQFSSLSLAWATANMDGNTELAASIKADKDDLTTEYNTKREEITNGN